MFYEQNQLDNLLNCPCCKNRFDLPLMLPCCWKTICKRCTEKYTYKNLESFKCPLCSKNQKLSRNGELSLPVNETLSKLLNIKPVDLLHADLYRKLGDLFKNIQSNLDELNFIEKHAQSNLDEFFSLIKNEIQNNTQHLIEQANKLKDRLISDLDYLKIKMLDTFKNLFSDQSNSKLLKFKHFCFTQLNEWQTIVNMYDSNHANSKLTENNLDLILKEAQCLDSNLREKNHFLNKTILNHKLVFNQKFETKHLLESFIGKFELDSDLSSFLNNKLSIKYLNDLIELEVIPIDDKLDPIYIVPLLFKKFLSVSKNSYDEFSDIKLRVLDTNGAVIHENNDLVKSKIDAVQSFSDFVCISLTDYKTGRNLIKLYDSNLCLVKTVIIDNQSDLIYMNLSNIYVKVEATYPFLFKYDYELNRLDLFDKSLINNVTSDLFVSLSVDKLVHVNSNRIYLKDDCFSQIKVYSELNGDLIETIDVKYLRDSTLYISNFIGEDSDLDNNGEQIICLNKNEKCMELYDKKGKLIVANKLDEKIRNITDFYASQDGSFVFVDYLNQLIYCYY